MWCTVMTQSGLWATSLTLCSVVNTSLANQANQHNLIQASLTKVRSSCIQIMPVWERSCNIFTRSCTSAEHHNEAYFDIFMSSFDKPFHLITTALLFSHRIWPNLKNDQIKLLTQEIPLIQGTFTCWWVRYFYKVPGSFNQFM